FHIPSCGEILTQCVPNIKLTKVNGINSSIQAIIMFVSPLVSAALLGLTSIEYIFFIDVITAAIAIFTLLFFLKIAVHEKAAAAQSTSYFGDFKKGLQYVNNHAFLKRFFIFFAIFFVLMAPASFLTRSEERRVGKGCRSG